MNIRAKDLSFLENSSSKAGMMRLHGTSSSRVYDNDDLYCTSEGFSI